MSSSTPFLVFGNVVSLFSYCYISSRFSKRHFELSSSNDRLIKDNIELNSKVQTLVKQLQQFEHVDVSKFLEQKHCKYCKRNTGIVCNACEYCSSCHHKLYEQIHHSFPHLTFWP